MKAFPKSLTLATAAGALLAASLALAQNEPRRERPPGDQPPPEGARRPGGDRPQTERPQGDRPGEFRGRPDGAPLNLTEEQREVMRAAMEANRDEMQEINERMRDARRGLQEATFAEKFNLDTVKARARDVAEVQAEMSVLQAKVFAKLRPKLTAEQIERLKNLPPEFALRGGMGFGGPGGPGGPGGFRPGGPDGPRPDGQRVNPDDAPRRPRGDAPNAPPAEGQPRRPAPDAQPK